MKLHTLPKTNTRSKKRLGRGHGSGRGKTAGRGTKGQNARGKMPLYFEGGQLPVLRRLPYLRGKGRNTSRKVRPVEITTRKLNTLPAKTTVTLDSLVKAGIVHKGTKAVKILAGGALDGEYTVSVPVTKGARSIIEKSGGTVS